MRITSSAFIFHGFIPKKYACDGDNISPPLEISNVPETAQSLVLAVDDPDAPGGTWVHWLVWDIPPATAAIEENGVPAQAIEGVTSFGKPGYDGPCPPANTHHYYFKLYALDIELNLPPEADIKRLEKAMAGHIIAKTEHIGLYSKK